MSKITEKQICEWKEKHGDVFELTVEDLVGYFKKPSRKTLMFASTQIQTNPLKFNEILMEQCWLGGDEALVKDDNYFLAVSGKLGEIIEIKQAEIKKL